MRSPTWPPPSTANPSTTWPAMMLDIASAVGAERLREIMTDLVNRAAVMVQRYGGTVGGFTGDGIMAVFGAPVALEDHAVRACLAAQKPDLARPRPARRRTAHLDPAA